MSAYHHSGDYQEALRRESEIRKEAWLALEEPIAGIEVAPLTLRKVIYLELAGNVFVGDRRAPKMYDCAQFLWVVSLAFRPGDEEARKAFYQKVFLKTVVSDAIQGIDAYLERSWFDLPGGGGFEGHCTPTIDWAAGLIHAFAGAYGWTSEDIQDQPIRQLLQLYRCIRAESDPDATRSYPNPLTDAVKAKHLESLNRN